MATEQEEKSFGGKALSTGYKVEGWNYRLKAISSFIIAIIFIIGGIILSVATDSFGGLILSVIGLFALFGGWFYWRRAKSLIKGRFY